MPTNRPAPAMPIRRRAAAWSATLVALALTLGAGTAFIQIAATGYSRSELQPEVDQIALNIGHDLAHQDIVPSTVASHTPQFITFGQWNATRRQFLPNHRGINAVQVALHTEYPNSHGNWLRWLPSTAKATSTSAVAALRPRDIVFIVDLSSTMTHRTRAALERLLDDTSEDPFSSEYREIRLLYGDLGFDSYPGAQEPFGAPWKVGSCRQAYETLIRKDGPLAHPETNERYRIAPGDSASVRRHKAYLAVIEQQVMRLMPQSRPDPADPQTFEYWAEYLDQLLASPDDATIGYATYLRFMLDRGRTIRAAGRYIPLSQYSDDCTWHTVSVDGAAFSVPPRTQPMNDVRLGLLETINDVALRNRDFVPDAQWDRVAIITFDSLTPRGAWVEQSLTKDYERAQRVAARLQAVGAYAKETTGLAALQLAEGLFRRQSVPGRYASKQIVFVTANPLLNDEHLDAQIEKMAGLEQKVKLISVGMPEATNATNSSDRGQRYGLESSIREAISSVEIDLVN